MWRGRLAGGATAARHMHADDAVCVGIYDPEGQGLLAEDVRLLEEALGEG